LLFGSRMLLFRSPMDTHCLASHNSHGRLGVRPGPPAIEASIDEHRWNPLATLNLKERFRVENRYPLTGFFTEEHLEDLHTDLCRSYSSLS
jgi:hypothetical protein